MAASTSAEARVAVLHGGRSTERDVSLRSGAAILEHLRARSDGRGPREVVGVEVRPDGSWRVDGLPPLPPDQAVRSAVVDLWFLGLHGGEGEDGSVQALLAALGQAHTGTGTRGSAIAMDKSAALAVAARAGLDVPAGREVGPADLADRHALEALQAFAGPTGWFVKPVCGGSSVGAGPARDVEQLTERLRLVFELEARALVEEAVVGTEVSVGVLDLVGEEPRALPAVEIRPHEGRFFDYEEKYSESGAEELCPAESLSPLAQERLAVAAVRAHRALGAEAYSRVDFLVVDDRPVFLELNTLPGFTERSLLPQEAAVAGRDFRSLCLDLVDDGLARGPRR